LYNAIGPKNLMPTFFSLFLFLSLVYTKSKNSNGCIFNLTLLFFLNNKVMNSHESHDMMNPFENLVNVTFILSSFTESILSLVIII